jgi:predicted RNase H-like nuclease
VRVLGIDGTASGWVVVELIDGRFTQAQAFETIQEALDAFPDAAAIAIDIPIGLPREGLRRADVLAREFVEERRASVFMTPPRAILEAETYDEANREAARRTGRRISRQAYGLRTKILEVDCLAPHDSRLIEVHPEVTFRDLAGTARVPQKRTWAGFWRRVELLRGVSIEVPVELGKAGDAGPDDVLDAAAAAFSASRYALGQASSLPAPPDVGERGQAVAIWY